MRDYFSFYRIIQIGIYSVAVGITIKFLALTWRYYWNIDIRGWEIGALAGATIAFITFYGINKGPGVAGLSAGLIIIGFFMTKLIKKYIGF